MSHLRVSESPALDHLRVSESRELTTYLGLILMVSVSDHKVSGFMVSESSVSDYALFGSQGVVLPGGSKGATLGKEEVLSLGVHLTADTYHCWVSRQIAGCWTTGCRTAAGSDVRLLAVGPQGVVPLLSQTSDC